MEAPEIKYTGLIYSRGSDIRHRYHRFVQYLETFHTTQPESKLPSISSLLQFMKNIGRLISFMYTQRRPSHHLILTKTELLSDMQQMGLAAPLKRTVDQLLTLRSDISDATNFCLTLKDVSKVISDNQ